jgi:hypothetical protein
VNFILLSHKIDQFNLNYTYEKDQMVDIRGELELFAENEFEELKYDFVLVSLASVFEAEIEYFRYHEHNLYI